MALFRSERGIGRGEIAESRIEAPFFAAFMAICAVALLFTHLRFGNDSLTIALAVSMIVFGVTVLRVELGVSILIIAMLLSPEIAAGSVGRSGERSLNLRYDDVLIVVIFFGVLVKLAFEGAPSFVPPSPINWAIVAYYGVCIHSTLLALNLDLPAWDKRVAFFVMLKMLEFYMVFFMVGNAIRTRKDMRIQVGLLLAVASIVSVYAAYTVGHLDRVSAPLEEGGTEPNTLGGYLTVVMCLTCGLFLTAPRWKKLIFLGITAVALYPFLYTLSRASYMALVVGLIALGLKARRAWVVILMIFVLAFSNYLMPKAVRERVNYTFQEGSGKTVSILGHDTGIEVDTSTHERLYVWDKVKYNLHYWPWFGGGVSWETVLDSQYARVILETGLVGLAAFIFLLWRILRTTSEAASWTKGWFARGVALGTFATTIALIVHSMGTISFLIVRIMEPFWLLVALTNTIRNIALQEHWQNWYAQQAEQKASEQEVTSDKPLAEPLPAGSS